MAHAFKGAAQFGRNGGIQLCETLHMGFVDHCGRPGNDRPVLILPVKLVRIDYPALRRVRRAVPLVEGEILVFVKKIIREMRLVPLHLAHQFAGIRIDQQLVRIEPTAIRGIVGAVDTVSVKHVGLEAGHIAVPDLMRVFRKLQPRDLNLAAVLEKAEFDPLSMSREDGEVDAVAVKTRSELKA